MGLLFWKNNRQLDAVARSLADDLFSHVRPDVARQYVSGTTMAGKNRKQARKTDQKFTDVFLQIKRYGEANSLGIYGKARLQKKFNERLEELGYEADVVMKIAESFLLRNP
jgi:hypothetical protein